jgi:DNA-3-methyladenine glycosylase
MVLKRPLSHSVHEMGRPLAAEFYRRDAVTVARALLGRILVHETPAGRIIETEAYLGREDPASHAYRGPTQRNAVMFQPGGRAYVYFTYGMHFCMNVVTGGDGEGQAVLLRALEPLEGLELMARRRGLDRARELCSGPAKLAQALGIARPQNGLSLLEPPLYILEGSAAPLSRIVVTTRVGIREAADRPLRFYVRDNEHVSRK